MSTELRIVNADQLMALDLNNVDMQWPADTFGVLAIEDGTKVVGQTAILNIPMIEGTIVAPEKKGTSLAYRLIKRVEELYLELGKTAAFAMAADEQPEVGEYLERVGYKRFPVTLYVKELKCP